jgi:hypothetical protein
MGYKPETQKATKYTFTDYPGLEVYAVTPSMGELMDVADLKMNFNDAQEKRMRAFDTFVRHVKTWNIEHPEVPSEDGEENPPCPRCGLREDEPLPTTSKHFMCLPMPFTLGVFFGWLSTVSRVDPTKFINLNSGGQNIQEDLMRMLGEMQNPMPSSEPNMS